MEGILGLLLWALVLIIIIIIVYAVLKLVLNEAFGQEAPAPITPTPVPTPTPTSPNPNLQYLPQKAYVQAYAPENGIPSTSGALQVVPQVVPVQNQTASIGGLDIGSIMGYLAAIGSAGAYIKGHLVGKKTDKVEETTKEQSAQIVKGAVVDEKIAERVYKNMSDGGTSINDAPEIRLDKLVENKEEALETASKA